MPIRTCVGCRRKAPAVELSRFVLRDDGAVVCDRRGTGRGAWLCADSAACCTEAVRRRAFGRAFRRTVEPAGLLSLAGLFEPAMANVRESRVAGSDPAPSPPRKG